MKIKIVAFLFLVSSFTVFSQDTDRKPITGKVVVKTDELEGITVYNKSTKKGTSTDTSGNFEITVGLNDILVFGALQFEDFEANITEEILESKRMVVYLIEEVNKLDEVLILPYDLTGYLEKDVEDVKTFNPDMDAIYFGIKKQDEYEFRDDYKSSVDNIALHSQSQPIITNGLNVKNLIGLFFKKKEKSNNQVADVPINNLRTYYSDDYISNNFKIPKAEIDEFVVFLEKNGLDYNLLRQGKEMQFLEFINQKSQVYLLTQGDKN
ncbi:carboxypeptidase-like regulatory domain-containing protein [Ichthyenterobacterium sp. W332]|uniref:Carboxypeptidase-like regulatory domain-containing protein n=1 Tax=Microcosmobacter mediterraneus TaxID=3075607 RepID=A0ABU2YJL8_9FLAO|nr:carboxypeptidase-like regulatory domain-containing protein [Ichthyenterobacterium sp. W332]MDT0558351.1 carboxypeptidase-like regulatory domain-containing protein [Ichthyenterobacterium sp. W332]